MEFWTIVYTTETWYENDCEDYSEYFFESEQEVKKYLKLKGFTEGKYRWVKHSTNEDKPVYRRMIAETVKFNFKKWEKSNQDF